MGVCAVPFHKNIPPSEITAMQCGIKHTKQFATRLFIVIVYVMPTIYKKRILVSLRRSHFLFRTLPLLLLSQFSFRALFLDYFFVSDFYFLIRTGFYNEARVKQYHTVRCIDNGVKCLAWIFSAVSI